MKPILYTALGDSLAAGLLFSYGYVYRYRDFLKKNKYTSQKILLANLGHSGWTSKDLLMALKYNKTFSYAVKKANILTLDIGGNDLRGCKINRKFSYNALNSALKNFETNFPEIINIIRKLNPSALFLATNIYNPYPSPQIDDRWAKEYSLARHYIPWFNKIILDTFSDKKLTGLADVYTAFLNYEKTYTWIDKLGDIHPNNLGHQAIANCLSAVTPEIENKQT